MNLDETTVFLGFLRGLDTHIRVDEISTSSWANVLPPEITLDQAIGYAKQHYLEHDRTIMPAHVAGRYYAQNRAVYASVPVVVDCGCVDGWEIVEENGHTAARKCSHQ